MPLLLLSPRYTADSIVLGEAAQSAGWDVRRLHGWRVPPDLPGDRTAVYGEPLFAAFVAQALGVALLEPPFAWLAALPPEYLQRRVRALSLEQARQKSGPAFFKPADDKCFPAAVYPAGEELPASEVLPPSTPVLIADPVTWEAEFRCFVLNRQVAALSPYWRAGQLAQAEDGSWPASPGETTALLDFIGQLQSEERVPVPPAVVIDVGIIAGRGWAVVEANPASAAGIYGCDPAGVLPMIARATVRERELTPEDMRWVIQRASEETADR
jgi:hypothetical protein